jgi:hypothetical protein
VEWIYVGLLAGAVAVLVAAEWPRLSARFDLDARMPQQRRARRSKAHLKLVENETDDFAASVQRDLERLPTIDERDR